MKTFAPSHLQPRMVLLRILLVIGLLVPDLLVPMQLAMASEGNAPLSIQEQLTNLRQTPAESTEAYLQRMATAQPELFQQAAMAALQDALNGGLPEQPGEQALEAQMAFYIDQAVQEAMQEDTTWVNPFTTNHELNGASSPSLADWGWDGPALTHSQAEVVDDSYQWQSSAFDTTSQSVAGWQMAVTPRSDPALFAQEFEALLGQGMPSGGQELALANGSAVSTLGPSQITHQILPLAMPELPAEFSMDLEPTTAELWDLAAANLARHADASGRVEEVQTAAPNAVAVPEDTLYADLQLNMTAPVTAVFDTVITYTMLITNAGPANASNVRVVQNLPANGLFEASIGGCSVEKKVLTCNTGALNATVTRTLDIPIKMMGDGALPSTVTISDSAGTLDNNKPNNTATMTTTVSSPTRAMYTFNNVVIAANSFVTATGKVTAEGAVFLAMKDTPPKFFIKLGPNDSISWEPFVNGTLTAEGATVGHITADTDLFKGNFTIDSTAPKPIITPVTPPPIEILYNTLGSFEVISNTRTLSKVELEKGEATVTATIKMSQPGITTTNQVVEATIKPGPIVEGTIKTFSMIFGSVSITATNTTFTNDAITVANAQIRLPATFGGLTGVIANMKITKNGISFGGAGVKVPFPDITLYSTVITPTTSTVWLNTDLELLNTVPLTPTAPYTNSLKLVQNSATIGVFDGVYALILDGKMQIEFPDNSQTVEIQFTISQNGLAGKVDKITFKVAGYDLVLTKAELKDGVLTVKEATLELPKKKKPAPQDGQTPPAPPPNPLELAAADDPPASFQLKSIILKDVSISKDGLKIGGGGGKFGIPDVKFGDTVTLTKLFATVKYTGRNQSYEFGLEGVLAINLDVVSQPITFTAIVDNNGNVSGTIQKIELTIAQTRLEMNGVKISKDGFEATTAKLTLPPILGSRVVNVSKVVINGNGISFGDVSVKIPIEFTIGDPASSTNMTVKGDLGLDVTKDKKVVFRVEGTVTLKVAGQTIEAKGKVSWDKSDGVQGQLEEFALTVAGLKLAIKDGTIEDGVWKAKEASLEIPKEWGGLSATIYNVEAGNGEFKMGGGEFQLPEISVADMKLTVKGKLKREGDGYVIAATGSFKMPNMGGAGCSGLKIGVEIYAGPTGQVVVAIEPLRGPEEISAVQLREITVGLNCTIPLGASGFDLTEVSGTLTLQSNTTKIDIRAKIESKLRVGPFNALTANGNMGIEYARNPNKFEVNIGAAMTVFSMFQAADAKALMRFTEGADVPFLFKAEMNINVVIAKGNVQLAAWTDKGEFNLVGRIYGQIGARKGALLDQCISLPVIVEWRTWWGIPYPVWGMRPVCLTIPPSDWYIDAGIEFGKFQKDGSTAWGLKAEVEVFGKRFGIYVDTSGTFSVGNVSSYKTVTIPTLQRAQWLQQQLANGTLGRAALSAEDLDLVDSFHFASTGEVYIDIVDLQEASDLSLFFLRSPLDPDIKVTLIRPDGYEITPANLPSNATWTETNAFPTDTGQPVLVPATQIDLSIKDAEQGLWRAKLSRQPNYEFLVEVIGLSRGPAVSDLAITEQNFDEETITLEWMQTEGLTSTVTIYATQDTITTTASYTDTQMVRGADGIMASQVVTVDFGTVTRFEGIPLAVFEDVACVNDPSCAPPPDTRQVQLAEDGMVDINQVVDMSEMRSGVYRLWIEVDDGEGHPSRTYFPGTVTVGRFADPSAPDTWTSNVTAVPSFGTLQLNWDAHPNPDVHWYEVELTSRGIQSEDVYRIAVGGALSETIVGLPANQTYTVTVWTYDTASSIYQASEAIAVTMPAAPYSFSATPANISVIAGQSAAGSLTLSSAITPYPETVVLFIDEEPIDISLELATAEITPTVGGATTAITVSVDGSVPSGTYTATLAAVSSSGEEILHLPIHVQQGQIELNSSQPSLTLTANETATVQLSTDYNVGSAVEAYVELIDYPTGLDWEFSTALISPTQPVTLVISDTEFLAHGTYTLTFVADDGYNEAILELPLTVQKPSFALLGTRDNRTALPGQTVTYTTYLETTAWPDGVLVAFDPASLIGRFTAEVTSAPLPTAVRAITVTGSAVITAVVTINEDTPIGVYELALQGTSNGISTTLPLYLTVSDEAVQGDVNITRTPIEDAWAGLPYSYTLVVQNAGFVSSTAVSITEQVDAEYLTLVDGDGCTYDAGSGTLTCLLGDIDPLAEVSRTITWELAEDTPEAYDLTHAAQVWASNEISEYDNTADGEAFVERFSNLTIDLDSTPITAGLPFSYTVTITNSGPAYDENVVVELYLPWDAWMEAAPVECDYDSTGVLLCELGAMAPGEVATFELEAYADEEAFEVLESIIIAYGASIDWDLEDNILLLESAVESVADLSLLITPDRTKITEGETITYTVLLTNDGPSWAGAIELSIEYPDLADIVDIQINEVANEGQDLSLSAAETLTMTLVMRFMEDDGGIPFELGVFASADNAPEVWEANTAVQVANSAPVITMPAMIEIEEGSYDILTANVVDAGDKFDPLTITWDLNDDGQFTDGYGATALFNAQGLAGPATSIVHVRAEDDDGGVSEWEATVQINNVAPMVFAGPPMRLPYTATFTLNPAFFDQSPSDTHNGRVEWGDGTISNVNIPAQAEEFTAQHTYNQVGNFEVKVCVTDDSGAEGCEKVMAYAACQEHGLSIEIKRQGNNVVLNLHNASGNVTIPASLPLTLYEGDTKLQTVTVGQDLAVGQSHTLTYPWPNASAEGFYVGVAVDEDNAGQKTTPLCSGMVRSGNLQLRGNTIFLPTVFR